MGAKCAILWKHGTQIAFNAHVRKTRIEKYNILLVQQYFEN